MRLLVISSIFLAAFLAIPQESLSKEDKYKWECRKKEFNHHLDTPNFAKECKEEYRKNPPFGRTGPLCEAHCTAMKLSAINKHGAANRTGLHWRVDRHFVHEDLKQKTKDRYDECVRAHGKSIESGPSDPLCLNYGGFWGCIWLETTIICENEFDPDVLGIDVKLPTKS